MVTDFIFEAGDKDEAGLGVRGLRQESRTIATKYAARRADLMNRPPWRAVLIIGIGWWGAVTKPETAPLFAE